VRICFVCSGNICRSPTAEVVFAQLARSAGRVVEIDSAGIGDWHVGADMDPRSRATLVEHGYAHGVHAARQFQVADFAARDLVVALDRGHVRELNRLAAADDDPASARAKIVLLRQYDPQAVLAGDLDVGDPYYGGADGFHTVLRDIEVACAALLRRLPAADD